MLHDQTHTAVSLLQRLIATPSISRDEAKAADIIEEYIAQCGIKPQRIGNNVWAAAPNHQLGKPTLLLNAHIDTVKPVASWQRNPFEPITEGDRLYGLGSNDCGGGLTSLLHTFLLFASPQAPKSLASAYNLIFLASAEEEVSGANGIALALPQLPKIDLAIVGEPTGMHPAIAEKGLMVIDLVAHGKSGHAARGEGDNAIYKMLSDLQWISTFQFPRVSPLLGSTLMQATQINAGTQHNVVPDLCTAVVDVRTNELYTNEEVHAIIAQHCQSEARARSFRLHSSAFPADHPLIKYLITIGREPYGSPTLSDQALMPFPSFKLGPGESSRSHTADEFICISEIDHAISIYLDLLSEGL